MKDIRIGTSGYDYMDWVGAFYPEDLRRDDFLEFYSRTFSTVELNFSYYRMPSAGQMKRFLEKSGAGMDISLKAHRSMTHEVDSATWKESAGDFARSVEPLLEAQRLAAVLLQFPFSFHYTPENRQYLDRLIREIHLLPLVVEFRNMEWQNKRVLDSLRERSVGFCSVDTPPLRGLPAPLDVVTSSIAYVRFHGRNEKTWWGSDAAARFDYLYSEEELKPWIERLAGMAAAAGSVRVYFNNHRRGQAPANAAMLRHLMEAM
jgi:uncharacterized protein YecE (DUF72 family)